MTAFTLKDVVLQAVGERRVALMKAPIDIAEAINELQELSPDGVLLIADDLSDLIHRLRTGLEPLGFLLRRLSRFVHPVQTSKEQGEVPGPAEIGITNGTTVNIIDTGGTVVDQLHDFMDHQYGGLAGRTVIVARHNLARDEGSDPFRSAEVTGCIFKPFVPEDYLDQILAELQAKRP